MVKVRKSTNACKLSKIGRPHLLLSVFCGWHDMLGSVDLVTFVGGHNSILDNDCIGQGLSILSAISLHRAWQSYCVSEGAWGFYWHLYFNLLNVTAFWKIDHLRTRTETHPLSVATSL